MARLFDNPMMLLIILLVVMVLFGAPRLPGMARSLGQSLRIFRSEVQELKQDVPTDSPGRSRTAAPHPGPGKE